MLISQDVAPPIGRLHGSSPSNVHTVPDLQPELLDEHGQVEREGVRRRVKLAAHPLEQEVGFVAQQ